MPTPEPIEPFRYPVVSPISQAQLANEVEELLRLAGLINDGGPEYSVWIGGSLDNVHDQDPRRYGQVITDTRTFEFATATLQLPYCHRLGLFAHEVGHVLVPSAGEDRADRASAEVLGIRIGYDRRWPGKGLQFALNCR